MHDSMLSIDSSRFSYYFDAFKAFVEGQSGTAFVSFDANPYTYEQEGYKSTIHREGRDALAFETWTRARIGTGDIAKSVIQAIEIPGNNLLMWDARHGAESRAHNLLHEVEENTGAMVEVEQALFNLYRTEENARSFSDLTALFGRRYPLLAYLFFLKDRSRFLPIAPTSFDRAFKLLGVNFKTSHQAGWRNYQTFVDLIAQLKSHLSERLQVEVTLLDAHSFAWILVHQMKDEGAVPEFDSAVGPSEREAIVKARVGQGLFRRQLLDYWAGCAVTGCEEETLLIASHIKPWKDSTDTERLDLHNGLLLSPTLDRCFDVGLISFDDEGFILISSQLSTVDAEVLGIRADMRLRAVDSEHRGYLDYHRQHLFIE